MTDISKYKSLAVSHDCYDKIGKIAKNIAPGVTLSRAQTMKVIVDEKVKKLNGKLTINPKAVKLHETFDPERNLWRNVLIVALEDALGRHALR